MSRSSSSCWSTVTPSAEAAVRHIATQPVRNHRPKQKPDPLDEYFAEQTKLFDHLQQRLDKFNKRAVDEKAKAKKERNRIKANPAPAPVRVNPPKQQLPAAKQPPNTAKTTPAPSPPLTPVSNTPHTHEETKMQAGNATAAALRPIASSSRSISSTAVNAARAKKKRVIANPDAMGLNEAVRVLRALEIGSPSSAYSLTLNTRISKSTLPLRGRIALPTDARKTPETILVFCDPESADAGIARSAGAAYVGGEELFPQILSGAITPTKCLATPSMMSAVQTKLARFLGPKGLMPVAKRGGVGEGEELATRIREAGGLMEWKADKLGVVRAPVARMNFEIGQVAANVRAFASAVRESSAASAIQAQEASNSKKKQPSGIISARIETTHGPSVEINDLL